MTSTLQTPLVEKSPKNITVHVGISGVIFLLALCLRVWGVGYGMPYVQLPDETSDISSSFDLVKGGIPNYTYHRVAWSTTQLPLHALHFLYRYLQKPGFSTDDFEALYFTDRGSFIVSARIYAAIFSALCSVIAYAAGVVVTQTKAGGSAFGLAMALHPWHAYLGHYALPESFSTFCTALFLLACILVMRSGTRYAYGLLGAAGSLAILTKMNLLPLIGAGAVLAHVASCWLVGKRSARWLMSCWLWALAAFLITHIIWNPFIVLKPQHVLNDINRVFTGHYIGTFPNVERAYTPTVWENISANARFPFIVIRPYLAICAAVGVLLAIWHKQWAMLVIAVSGAALVASMVPIHFARITYWFAICVPSAFLTGYGFHVLWTTKHAAIRNVTLITGIIVAGWMLYENIRINSVLSATNTQMLAYNYITTHIPEGTPILQGDSFTYSVPLARTTDSMQRVSQFKELQNAYAFFLSHPNLNRHPAYNVYGSEYIYTIHSDAEMLRFLSEHRIAYVVETDYCGGRPATYVPDNPRDFPGLTDSIQRVLQLEYVASPFDIDRCLQPIAHRTNLVFMRLGDWRRAGPIVRVYRVLSENIRNVSPTGLR